MFLYGSRVIRVCFQEGSVCVCVWLHSTRQELSDLADISVSFGCHRPPFLSSVFFICPASQLEWQMQQTLQWEAVQETLDYGLINMFFFLSLRLMLILFDWNWIRPYIFVTIRFYVTFYDYFQIQKALKIFPYLVFLSECSHVIVWTGKLINVTLNISFKCLTVGPPTRHNKNNISDNCFRIRISIFSPNHRAHWG